MEEWDRLAVVGQVARPHGLRGQVIVNVETDFPDERFAPNSELFVKRGDAVDVLRIEEVRFHRGRPIITFSGVDSIEGAQALAGAELRVPLDRLMPLPPGAFYRHDLVGCRVERVDGASVGVVTGVETESGGARLVIRGAGGGDQVLVPLAAEICVAIEPSARRIVIDPPEGLLELNALP